MIWYLDKESKKLCATSGKWYTWTGDWNHDGDVYTETVMVMSYLNGTSVNVRKDDMCDYEFVPGHKVDALLKKRIDDYFLKGEHYYCDPTMKGELHYGDYSFMKGGRVIFGEENDRQEAICKEVEFVLGRMEARCA